MTDEQFLMYAFGKDLMTKSAIVFSLKKTMNSTLQIIAKTSIQNQENTSNTTQNITKNQYKEKEYDDDYDDDDDDDYDEILNEDYEEINPIRVANDVPKKDEDAFAKKMNINMPQKPKGNFTEHPKEVQNIIKEGIKRRKQ
jgi:hypothetical protein